jgi:NAD(P)-dependent dehydrogenase (short-subunit alcohol dehydrogenase family)
VRDTGAGDRTAAAITDATRNDEVRAAPLDLADQASVAAFAAGWSGPLHLLVNNAGVMALPGLQLTPEGWEMQFATNHLGHFVLAYRLHDALAAAPERESCRSRPAATSAPRSSSRTSTSTPALRPVARLRAVQDRQRAVRRRGDAPLGS